MSEETVKTYADYVLPPSIVSKVDVSRMIREAEWVDNELTTAAIRAKTGAVLPAAPSLSPELEAFLQQNGLTLTNGHERGEIIKQLRLMKDKLPVIHITFAVPADRESLQQLSAWLRASIHPQAVIAVGLQPALIAGVYVRTPNHVHDLSMRAALNNGHGILVKELEALRG